MSLYLGTSPIANTGYDKANTDLSNLTNTGKNIANWSNNVTNCITSIPQDIKLELNNGTLTLKAGSKVYVPNGVGVFDVVTVPSDVVFHSGTIGSATGTFMLFCNSSGGFGVRTGVMVVASGSTSPGSGYYVWYDTTNNKIKYSPNADGTFGDERYSLPITIYQRTNGVATSINQVFNGFGYIGSTVFALPGVKGLIPNGRNEDGSLKNIEFTVSSVFTRTFTWDISGSGQIFVVSTTGLASSGTNIPFYQQEEIPPVRPYTYWYKPSENILYANGSGTTWYKTDLAVVGRIVGDNTGKITSFTHKRAFHAVDRNDSSTIAGWSMPSSRYIDLTLGASGSTYTAPANGWVFFQDTGNQPYSALVLRTNYIRVSLTPGTNGNPIMSEIMPVKKGDIFYADYVSITGENRCFRFVYAEGEN